MANSRQLPLVAHRGFESPLISAVSGIYQTHDLDPDPGWTNSFKNVNDSSGVGFNAFNEYAFRFINANLAIVYLLRSFVFRGPDSQLFFRTNLIRMGQTTATVITQYGGFFLGSWTEPIPQGLNAEISQFSLLRFKNYSELLTFLMDPLDPVSATSNFNWVHLCILGQSIPNFPYNNGLPADRNTIFNLARERNIFSYIQTLLGRW